MEELFTIPERPWGEAEVNYLAANVHLLDEETRAELGFVPAPVEDFKADLNPVMDEGTEPVVETGTIDPVGVVGLDGTPVTQEDIEAGLAAFDALSPEDQEAARASAEVELAGLPTDIDGEVVNNEATDKV